MSKKGKSTDYGHLKRTYNKRLADAGLGMASGQFMTNAPHGRGKTIVGADRLLEQADVKASDSADVSRAKRAKPSEKTQAERMTSEADFDFRREVVGVELERNKMRKKETCKFCSDPAARYVFIDVMCDDRSVVPVLVPVCDFHTNLRRKSDAQAADLTARRHTEMADVSGGFKWGRR
jgi:hypothetical protein